MTNAPAIIIARDMGALHRKAAQIFLETAAAAVQARGRCSIALSGGNTPKGLFELMATPYYRDRFPWAQTHFFWGDERCVPPDHGDSNYKMAHDLWLSKVPLPPANLHRMPGEMADPREAAKAYEQSMKLFFREDGAWPKLDLDMLGMGDDGHTASLFPGTTAVQERMKWVTANFVERLSSNRITMTLPVLNNARVTLFLVSGAGKAGVLHEIFRDDAALRYPAQMVRPAGELTWLLDAEAASRLPAAALDRAARV